MWAPTWPALYHYAPLDHALEIPRQFRRRGSASAGRLSARARLHPVAGGMEIWRARISLLSARRRPCDRRGGSSRGGARLARACPLRAVRRRNIRAAWPRAGRRRASARARAPRTIGLDRSRSFAPRAFRPARHYRRGARLAWSGEPVERGSRRLAARRSRVSTLPQAARRGRSRPAAEGVFARRRKRSIHRRGRARATQRATLRRKINAPPRRVFLDAGGDNAGRGAAARRIPMAGGADARLVRPPRRGPGARTLSAGPRRSSRRAIARGLFCKISSGRRSSRATYLCIACEPATSNAMRRVWLVSRRFPARAASASR